MKTKDRILDCAEKLFSEEGFEKVTTKKISKKAGCNEVTIFRIFGTKNRLLEEILNRFVEKSKIIKILHESLTGDLKTDISRSMYLYQSFLEQHEIIFRLQLKLSDGDSQKFLRTIDFKNYLIDHFIEVFYINKIELEPEIFVNNMLSSIMGGFLLKILTKEKFSNNKDFYFLDEKIKYFQNTISQYMK